MRLNDFDLWSNQVFPLVFTCTSRNAAQLSTASTHRNPHPLVLGMIGLQAPIVTTENCVREQCVCDRQVANHSVIPMIAIDVHEVDGDASISDHERPVGRPRLHRHEPIPIAPAERLEQTVHRACRSLELLQVGE